MIDLHWLSVAARIEFKIRLLAYQSLDSTAPAYISDNAAASLHTLTSN